MKKLTMQQTLQIAGEAAVDPRTVAKIYAGKKAHQAIRKCVEDAAKKLKIQGPPSTGVK